MVKNVSCRVNYWSLGVLLLIIPSCQDIPDRTEILWDTWGVPHIFAKDNESLFHAFGWAQMKNHGDLILRLYGQARGRAAEYWGEPYLETDKYVRTMGIPERAAEWYDLQKEEYRSYLDAFASGMNSYVESHGEMINDEVKIVLPVEPVDVLAHTQRVFHSFVASRTPSSVEQWVSRGSNAWAISPARSESGNAMLLANPHLPWSDLFTWFEVQLSAPGLNAYGAALAGMPILGIAFNDNLGWSHTDNTMDGMDLYELSVIEEGYKWEDGVRPFESETQIMKVKESDGSLREEELVIRRSVHGPVLAEKNGKAIAIRVVGLDRPHIVEQYWKMVQAANLEEFESALKLQQQPFFNVIYADREGHILYLFGGLTPKRTSGGWDFWQGIVPGDDPEYLWTETHGYDDLPRVVDPPGGWVQNANDPPWTSTFPMMLDPTNFPAYMAPKSMAFRPQRSVRMLEEDDKISFEELIEYKHSTRMELADRILDDLLPAARELGNGLAHQAAEILQAWDREADAESRGAVLFTHWVGEIGSDMFAEPWNAQSPRTTPDGLRDPAAAVSALETAANSVIEKYGSLDVPWGDVYRFRSGSKDFPANGGSGRYGIFRVIGFDPDEDNRYRTVFGDSYVAAIEFSDPVRAQVLVSYGNASQPGSPHRGDQLDLLSQKMLRPVWRTRQEVELNLKLKEIF